MILGESRNGVRTYGNPRVSEAACLQVTRTGLKINNYLNILKIACQAAATRRQRCVMQLGAILDAAGLLIQFQRRFWACKAASIG
jgi:hypothetical protein